MITPSFMSICTNSSISSSLYLFIILFPFLISLYVFLYISQNQAKYNNFRQTKANKHGLLVCFSFSKQIYDIYLSFFVGKIECIPMRHVNTRYIYHVIIQVTSKRRTCKIKIVKLVGYTIIQPFAVYTRDFPSIF